MRPTYSLAIALTLAASLLSCTSTAKKQQETQIRREDVSTQNQQPPAQIPAPPAAMQQPGAVSPDIATITAPSGTSGCNCTCLSNPANPATSAATQLQTKTPG